MSLIDQAAADILAATSPDILGSDTVINGTTVQAVTSMLTAEELAIHGFDGLSVEGMTMTLPLDSLPHKPRRGQEFEIDGTTWTVHQPKTISNLLQLILTRYMR